MSKPDCPECGRPKASACHAPGKSVIALGESVVCAADSQYERRWGQADCLTFRFMAAKSRIALLEAALVEADRMRCELIGRETDDALLDAMLSFDTARERCKP